MTVVVDTVFYHLDEILKQMKSVSNLLLIEGGKRELAVGAHHVEQVKKLVVNEQQPVTFDTKYYTKEERAFMYSKFADSHRDDKTLHYISLSTLDVDCPMFLYGEYSDSKLDSLVYSVGEEWDIELDYIAEATGKPIAIVSKYLMMKWPVVQIHNIPVGSIERFFENIDTQYPRTPFHNSIHAIEVLNSFLYFFNHTELMMQTDTIEYISIMIAALGHDLGYSKDSAVFGSDLGYNDKCVIRNMTCSIIFSMLLVPENNILLNLTHEEWTRSKHLIVYLILKLDPTEHFQIIERFKLKSFNLADMKNLNKDSKKLLFTIGLKCADYGYAGKSFIASAKWGKLLHEEFCIEGDMLREKNLPLRPFSERTFVAHLHFEILMLSEVIYPMYNIWITYLKSPKCDTILKQITVNINEWKRQKEEQADVKSIGRFFH